MSTLFTNRNQSSNSLDVGGTMDIYAAEELRDVLRQEVQTRPNVILDLSQVEACDTTGLQVLCSAMRTAHENGSVLRIARVSKAVTTLCGTLGLSLDSLEV